MTRHTSHHIILILGAVLVCMISTAQAGSHINPFTQTVRENLPQDFFVDDGDTIFFSFIPPVEIPHSGPLTEADFNEIAALLDVEAAAIRAVVDVETGLTRSGFHIEGKPLVNFDLSVFRRALARRGINLSTAQREHPDVFRSPQISRYGSQQAAEHALLEEAMAIDSIAAIESTFWGMFQVGGFNWKLSGASSRQEFVELMGRSEYDQLLLFANFIRNTGMVKYLKTLNWAGFARQYNGAAYASRGYHTKMASAYRRYKNSSD